MATCWCPWWIRWRNSAWASCHCRWRQWWLRAWSSLDLWAGSLAVSSAASGDKCAAPDERVRRRRRRRQRWQSTKRYRPASPPWHGSVPDRRMPAVCACAPSMASWTWEIAVCILKENEPKGMVEISEGFGGGVITTNCRDSLWMGIPNWSNLLLGNPRHASPDQTAWHRFFFICFKFGPVSGSPLIRMEPDGKPRKKSIAVATFGSFCESDGFFRFWSRLSLPNVTPLKWLENVRTLHTHISKHPISIVFRQSNNCCCYCWASVISCPRPRPRPWTEEKRRKMGGGRQETGDRRGSPITNGPDSLAPYGKACE